MVVTGMAHLGLPQSLLLTFACLEILCIVLYLIPTTAGMGAILFTGYLGGAICTHLRVGESVVMPVILGVLVWLALYLREPRLWKILPLRRS